MCTVNSGHCLNISCGCSSLAPGKSIDQREGIECVNSDSVQGSSTTLVGYKIKFENLPTYTIFKFV